ncbi:response regulator transcription factor [Streptomyces sioyaensis]|uniref:response regulator transcription factor n=1 Tax=Streptomyces sioyaensis TaxID=67364 RepID=UPI003793A0B9
MNNEASTTPSAARLPSGGHGLLVLRLVGEGMSNAEIGATLHMGESTVKTHVSRLLAKLHCTNRVQAAILAHDAGLFPP